jgi:outer membrane protein TolC
MYTLTKRLNRMVKSLAALTLLAPALVSAQTLTLDDAFRLAKANYPVTKQKLLVTSKQELNIKNLNTAFLPQVTVNAQATYQSDVTQVDIPLPGVKVPEQPKDQYKLYADVSQVIYDGGVTRQQKMLQLVGARVEDSRIEVDWHTIRTRINHIYFSILYQQELLRQSNLLRKDIEIGINKVRPQVENGTLLRSNLLVLEAQLIQTQQRQIEIQNTKSGLIAALSSLTGQPFTDSIALMKPAFRQLPDSIRRPELELFTSQTELLRTEQNLLTARLRPKLNAFGQAGYGRPALNLFSNDFEPYYMGGVRFTWNFGSLYNLKRDRQVNLLNQNVVQYQRESFLLTTNSQLAQQRSDIRKFSDLLAADSKLIEVRMRISESAKAQLENSVITTSDYLREINAEDQARQNQILHELQLLQATANYLITSGIL